MIINNRLGISEVEGLDVLYIIGWRCYVMRAQGLVCIFAGDKNYGSPRSSPRRQRSFALHWTIQVLCQTEKVQHRMVLDFFWQGHKDLNPEPTVLETAALPIELYPYIYLRRRPE